MQNIFFIYLKKCKKKTAENLIPAATGFSQSFEFYESAQRKDNIFC